MKYATSFIVFSVALCLNISAAIAWYWLKPLPPFLYYYLPYLTAIVCGTLVGLFDDRGLLIKGVALAAATSIADGVVHWTAARSGLTTDVVTVNAIAVLSMLKLLYSIPAILIGEALGLAVKRLLARIA